MKTHFLSAVCASLLAIATTVAQASVTYEYVGVPYNYADGTYYQIGQKVTASITLTSGLAVGQSTPTPVSFTLFDENSSNEYITELTATNSSFWFDTNSSGDIGRWQFYAERLDYPTSGIGHRIGSYHIQSYTDEGGFGLYFDGSTWQTGAGGEYFNDTASALYGTWTVVPLPATVWLFGSGLLGVVAVARRQKTWHSRQVNDNAATEKRLARALKHC